MGALTHLLKKSNKQSKLPLLASATRIVLSCHDAALQWCHVVVVSCDAVMLCFHSLVVVLSCCDVVMLPCYGRGE